ncbi:hypothetical protein ACFLZH_04900 [Patescibacteria group bacterium]
MTDETTPEEPDLPDENDLSKFGDLFAEMVKDPAILDQAIEDHPEMASQLLVLNDRLKEVMEADDEEGVKMLTKDLICEITGAHPDDIQEVLSHKQYAGIKRKIDEQFERRDRMVTSKRMLAELGMIKLAETDDIVKRQAIMSAIHRIPTYEGGDFFYNNDIDKFLQFISEATQNRRERSEHDPTRRDWDMGVLRGEQNNMIKQEDFELFDLHCLDLLANEQSHNLSYALPSYALWRMFKRGDLKKLGIDDDKFLDSFTYNDRGNYMNFAEMSGYQLRTARLLEGINVSNEKVRDAVREEIEQIILELLPVINAKMSREGKTYPPAIIEYSRVVFFNRETGVLETSEEKCQGMNTICGRVVRNNKRALEGQKQREEQVEKNQERLNGGEEWEDKGYSLEDGDVKELKGNVPEDVPLVKFIDAAVERLDNLKQRLETIDSFNDQIASRLNEEWWAEREELKKKSDKAKTAISKAEKQYTNFANETANALKKDFKLSKRRIMSYIYTELEHDRVVERVQRLTTKPREQVMKEAQQLLALYDEAIREMEELKAQGGTIEKAYRWNFELSDETKAGFRKTA